MAENCRSLTAALDPRLVSVRLRLKYVEKYKNKEAFTNLSEGDKGELLSQIAPLIHLEDTDEFAKRFDNFIYGLILADMEQMPAFKHAKNQLRAIAAALEEKAGIRMVQEKMPLIREMQTDAFWEADDVLLFENVRKELRELIKFLDEGNRKEAVITRLSDPIIERQEGEALGAAYDFEDYRAKVSRYIHEHGNALAIYKLTHNIPLASGDYEELERVLTQELGNEQDYKREFGETPFGLLVRRIAKLDHEAAMEAFSEFINDQSLNQRQIAFVRKVIHYIEQNGYMDSAAELQKPPFDKPVSFVRLFDGKTRTLILEAINRVRDNAVHTVA